MSDIKSEWLATLGQMTHEGWAVVVWSPEELQGADPGLVQDRLIELGYDVIDCLKENEDARD